jgi:hypothetical protein
MSDPSDKANEGQASATPPPESATPTGGKVSKREPCDEVLGSRARDPPLPPQRFALPGEDLPSGPAKDPPALADIDAIRARELADRHIVENK